MKSFCALPCVDANFPTDSAFIIQDSRFLNSVFGFRLTNERSTCPSQTLHKVGKRDTLKIDRALFGLSIFGLSIIRNVEMIY